MSLIARSHGTLPHNFLGFLLPLLGAAVKTVAVSAVTSLATNAVTNLVNPPQQTATAGPAEEDLPSSEDVGIEEEPLEEEPLEEEFTTEPDVGAGPIGGTAPPPLEVPPQMRQTILSGPAPTFQPVISPPPFGPLAPRERDREFGRRFR